jgi:hypothetical protein
MKTLITILIAATAITAMSVTISQSIKRGANQAREDRDLAEAKAPGPANQVQSVIDAAKTTAEAIQRDKESAYERTPAAIELRRLEQDDVNALRASPTNPRDRTKQPR